MDKDKKKILVIDDDDNLRLALSDKLAMEGFSVLEAENGKKGLEKALETHPDLVVLDIMMPVMNGIDMLKELRKDEWGKKVKVIMLTVLENAETLAEAMDKTDLNTEQIVKEVKDRLNG